MCCQPYELDPTSIEERAGADKQCVDLILRQTGERSIDLSRRGRCKDHKLQASDVCGRLRITDNCRERPSA